MGSERARAHARRAHWCSCGQIVHGNGATYQHREMHRRERDGHGYVTRETYGRLFPDYIGGGSKRRVKGPRPSQEPECKTCQDHGWISTATGKGHPFGTCSQPITTATPATDGFWATCCDSLDGCPDCSKGGGE